MFLLLSQSVSIFTMNTKTTTRSSVMLFKSFFNHHAPSNTKNPNPDNLKNIKVCITNETIEIKTLNNYHTLTITQNKTATTKFSLSFYLKHKINKNILKKTLDYKHLITPFNVLQDLYQKKLNEHKKLIILLSLCRNSNSQ